MTNAAMPSYKRLRVDELHVGRIVDCKQKPAASVPVSASAPPPAVLVPVDEPASESPVRCGGPLCCLGQGEVQVVPQAPEGQIAIETVLCRLLGGPDSEQHGGWACVPYSRLPVTQLVAQLVAKVGELEQRIAVLELVPTEAAKSGKRGPKPKSGVQQL